MKKIICLLLAVLTLVSCVGVFAEETESTEEIEIQNAEGELTLEASVAVGIGAVTEYIPERRVTVADLALAVNALEPSGYLGERYFQQQAYDCEVKCIAAEAVMIDILGYSIFFEDGAIDPEDEVRIRSIAKQYKVSHNIAKKADETITMRELTTMIYNTLYAKTVETVYTADGTQSQVTQTPYMEKILGMKMIYGVVQSTSYASIIGLNGTQNGSVMIDGVTYRCEKGEYEDFLGMRVAALVKDTGNQLKLLSVFAYNNDVLELSADMLNHRAVTKSSISYWPDNGRAKYAKLSSTVDVLYNYGLYQDYTAEDFKLRQGKLILIDNNKDGSYDIVKIEEYTSFEVFSVSMDRMTISDTMGMLVDISALIDNRYPVIENGKTRIEPQNIPTQSVATCYTNKDGEVVRLYIDNQKAAGMVQGFESERNTVVLEEKEFRYVDEIKEKIEAVPLTALITVKLNRYGEIACFEISGDSVSYGYMIAFNTTGAFGAVKVKMFTQAGEISILKVADPVKLNGVRLSPQEAFAYNLTSGMWDEAGAIPQPVTYKRNSKGEIIAINTVANGADGNDERLHKNKDGVFRYFSNPKTLCADVRLRDTTKVFVIPQNLSDERYYKYGSYNVLNNDTEYTAQIYDVDENCYADCVVVRADPYGINSINELSGPVYMVHSVGEALSDEGRLTTTLKVRQLGQNPDAFTKFVFVNSDISATFQGKAYAVKDLQPGDIIMAETAQYAAGYGGFKILYRRGGTAPYEEAKMVWYIAQTQDVFYSDSNTYAAGKIKRMIENGCVANFKPEIGEFDNWNRVITFAGGLPVYICDSGKDELYRGSVGDLTAGDTVFALMNSGTMKEFVIYR